MGSFVPHTPAEIEAMLGFLGLDSIDDLFAHLPAAVRLAGGLAIDPGRSEADVLDTLGGLAGRNRQLICFAGGGAYEHDLPTAVRALAGRSEFVTSYTPYQPELAQGVLQALFEYQTMLCRISGMDVANASLYDAASAAVEGLATSFRCYITLDAATKFGPNHHDGASMVRKVVYDPGANNMIYTGPTQTVP